jgi:hypothetical protein
MKTTEQRIEKMISRLQSALNEMKYARAYYEDCTKENEKHVKPDMESIKNNLEKVSIASIEIVNDLILYPNSSKLFKGETK